jgi:hypothetical protein
VAPARLADALAGVSALGFGGCMLAWTFTTSCCWLHLHL